MAILTLVNWVTQLKVTADISDGYGVGGTGGCMAATWLRWQEFGQLWARLIFCLVHDEVGAHWPPSMTDLRLSASELPW